MRVLVMLLVVLVGVGPAAARTCEDAAAAMTAAFFRRLARDAGNSLAREGVGVPFAPEMAGGRPAPEAAPRVESQLRRLWWHTENKIHRKCSDTQAAALWPGNGATTGAVTDDLFNLFGLPWVHTVRSIVAPYGAECAQRALVQAGYAARDQIRRGKNTWPRYGRRVAAVCPPQVFAEVEAATRSILFAELDGLRALRSR